MNLRNTQDRYGVVHVLLHWLMALVIFAMFGFGLWMVELDYYDSWYKRGPDLHRSIGIMLVALLLLRLIWRGLSGVPEPLATHKTWERRLAKIMHASLYLLILLVATAGYLISTADGRSILVFDWFEIPAAITSIPNQEDLAGTVHLYLAVLLVSLASLHALAAVKHHVIDRDSTLLRMMGKS